MGIGESVEVETYTSLPRAHQTSMKVTLATTEGNDV